MNDPKTQIVEKLTSAGNILVTVSANPTVDQLAACIAVTLLLNKYKKSATAVFSGKTPVFLDFLHPKEHMSRNTDSLRDFIIALDKSKADKLRYKVEDDVVKIFITPYKTSITEKDLKYSAGEFNVDLILAIGVHHQQDLDKAITAHGRIFHDAVVMSINNSPGGDFGIANWEDVDASSLSELIAELIEALDPKLLDTDIATALLTGIVAETGRFSNEKTHPRTMTVSSRLLEAGANQQLVNTKLQDLIGPVKNLEAGTEIRPTADTSKEPLHHNDDDEFTIAEDGSVGQKKADKQEEEETAADAVLPEEPLPEDEPEDSTSGEPHKSVEVDLLAEAKPEDEPEAAPSAAEPTPTPTPEADTKAEDSGFTSIESLLGEPANVDSARQAIDSALAPAASAASPAAAPQVSKFAAPSQFTMPTIPEHEPAPLVNSPADQPFTMPLPQPGGPAPSNQSAPQPATGPTPPPLPPPMPPPGAF